MTRRDAYANDAAKESSQAQDALTCERLWHADHEVETHCRSGADMPCRAGLLTRSPRLLEFDFFIEQGGMPDRSTKRGWKQRHLVEDALIPATGACAW